MSGSGCDTEDCQRSKGRNIRVMDRYYLRSLIRRTPENSLATLLKTNELMTEYYDRLETWLRYIFDDSSLDPRDYILEIYPTSIDEATVGDRFELSMTYTVSLQRKED